jgi:hypothetical protein
LVLLRLNGADNVWQTKFDEPNMEAVDGSAGEQGFDGTRAGGDARLLETGGDHRG